EEHYVDRSSNNDLVGLEIYRRNGMDQGNKEAGCRRCAKTEPGIVNQGGDGGGSERAGEHYSFERDVNYAPTFGEQTAKGSQYKRRRQPEHRRQKREVYDVPHVLVTNKR